MLVSYCVNELCAGPVGRRTVQSVVGAPVLSDDVSYRRVVVSDVSRVVADKTEIDQLVFLSVCRDSCGDKLPSVGF